MTRPLIPFLLLALVGVASVAACSASSSPAPSARRERIGQTAASLSGDDAVNLAEQWVAVQLTYCQSPNGAPDGDQACSPVCNRYSDPAWDPYRSDCSGLVSWAWQLPPPGRVTWEFAPFQTDITYEIDGNTMQPGDACNNYDHIVLFKNWNVQGQNATFIEEPGCSSATPYAHEFTSDVSINGSNVYIAWEGNNFTAIRYSGLQSCTPSCQDANTIIGSDCSAGNCAAFGSQCVNDNLGARCVFYACPAQGTAAFCQDQSTIGNCTDGAVSFGNCGQFGANCVNDNLGARCVFSECPAQGTATVCMPDGHTIGTCNNGAITFGDCGVFGCNCVQDSLPARCVFYACPPDGDATVCMTDGHTLGNCHDGSVALSDCGATGTTCSTIGGTAHCEGPLDAKLVAKESPGAQPDPSKQADYTACAGQPVTLTLDVQDVGTFGWSDVNGTKPTDYGTAVRLGTSDGTKHDWSDMLTGGSRISITQSSNPTVSPSGNSCTDKSGCNQTVFTISGTAPATAGVVKTTWQMVDESRGWFGPVMSATFNVSACAASVSPGRAPQGATPGPPPAVDPGNQGGGGGSSSSGCSAAARVPGSDRTTPLWLLFGLSLVVRIARPRASRSRATCGPCRARCRRPPSPGSAPGQSPADCSSERGRPRCSPRWGRCRGTSRKSS